MPSAPRSACDAGRARRSATPIRRHRGPRPPAWPSAARRCVRITARCSRRASSKSDRRHRRRSRAASAPSPARPSSPPRRAAHALSSARSPAARPAAAPHAQPRRAVTSPSSPPDPSPPRQVGIEAAQRQRAARGDPAAKQPSASSSAAAERPDRAPQRPPPCWCTPMGPRRPQQRHREQPTVAPSRRAARPRRRRRAAADNGEPTPPPGPRRSTCSTPIGDSTAATSASRSSGTSSRSRSPASPGAGSGQRQSAVALNGGDPVRHSYNGMAPRRCCAIALMRAAGRPAPPGVPSGTCPRWVPPSRCAIQSSLHLRLAARPRTGCSARRARARAPRRQPTACSPTAAPRPLLPVEPHHREQRRGGRRAQCSRRSGPRAAPHRAEGLLASTRYHQRRWAREDLLARRTDARSSRTVRHCSRLQGELGRRRRCRSFVAGQPAVALSVSCKVEAIPQPHVRRATRSAPASLCGRSRGRREEPSGYAGSPILDPRWRAAARRLGDGARAASSAPVAWRASARTRRTNAPREQAARRPSPAQRARASSCGGERLGGAALREAEHRERRQGAGTIEGPKPWPAEQRRPRISRSAARLGPQRGGAPRRAPSRPRPSSLGIPSERHVIEQRPRDPRVLVERAHDPRSTQARLCRRRLARQAQDPSPAATCFERVRRRPRARRGDARFMPWSLQRDRKARSPPTTSSIPGTLRRTGARATDRRARAARMASVEFHQTRASGSRSRVGRMVAKSSTSSVASAKPTISRVKPTQAIATRAAAP